MAADAIGRHFTQISNSLFRDPRISGLAKATFGLISTHRDGYGISVEAIARHMKEGRDAIRKALRELERCGYLVRVQTRDPETGRLGAAVYRITDMPTGLDISEPAPYPDAPPHGGAPLAENQPTGVTCGNAATDGRFRRSAPLAENPSTATPTTVNPTPKKTNLKNTSRKNTSEKTSSPRSARTAHVGDAHARATTPQAAREEPKGKTTRVPAPRSPQTDENTPDGQRDTSAAEQRPARRTASHSARRVLGALPAPLRDGAPAWVLAQMAVRIDAMLAEGHTPGAIVQAAEEISQGRTFGERGHIDALREVRAGVRANAVDPEADVTNRCDGCGARRTGAIPCVICDPVEVLEVIDCTETV